jgi:NADPH:quinone reductase-like Zn-dependent oxidoreductase
VDDARVAHQITPPRDGVDDPMKAIVQDRYGSADVLELRDIDVPGVGSDDVLLRVRAASAHIGDWHTTSAGPK